MYSLVVLLIGITSCHGTEFFDFSNSPFFDACKERLGEDFDSLEDSWDDLMGCVTKYINPEEAMKETKNVIDNKIGGGLNDVFEKYCGRKTEVRNCFVPFKEKLDDCMEEENNITDDIMNVVDRILNFICYEDGNRMALFMAEEGIPCITMLIKNDKFPMCANNTLPSYQNTSESMYDVMKLFTAQEKSCMESFNFRDCILKEMENCDKPTPANLIEGLINEVLKASPCINYMSVSGGLAPFMSLSVVLIHTVFLYLLR